MCGPSADELALQKSSMSFANLLQQNYSTLFSNQLDVLNAINRSLSPTLSAGPNQPGFSGPELAARQTEAINNAAAANRSAMQAARTFGAGQGGGGTSGLTSGITKQIEAGIGTQSAQALSGRLDQITAENYATGRENYWRAAGGMQSLAAGYSPTSAMSGAISEGGQAFGEAKDIEQQREQTSQMIAGGLTSLAGSAARAFTSSDFAGQLFGGKVFGPGGFFG